MAKPKVLLRFDTEDYITPESNNALYDVLEILEEVDLKATFMMVGHKIQMLVDDGESAILDYLQHHALGYHTNMHSFHPLATEYLEGASWGEGLQKFFVAEEIGHKVFVEIFDQPPICFTQPGADWVPHAYIALQQWEVPFFFTDAQNSLLNYHTEPFMVNGILTLAGNHVATDLTKLATSPETLEQARKRFLQEYQRASTGMGSGIITLVCHPDRFATTGKTPWDVLNFANGDNKPRDQWQSPPLKSSHEYSADLQAFKDFLLELMEEYECDWMSSQDLVDIYQNRIIHKDRVVDTLTQQTTEQNQRKMLDFKTVQELAKEFTQNISFQYAGDIWLTPIQVASILCQALVTRSKEGYFPRAVPLPNEIFFPEEIPNVQTDDGLDRLGWAELVRGSTEIITQIKKDASFPALIKVSGDQWVSLSKFIGGVAQAIVTMTIDNLPQDRVLLPTPRLQTAEYVKKIDQVKWDWPIYRFGFRNGEVLKFTELLSWTMKPVQTMASIGEEPVDAFAYSTPTLDSWHRV